MSDSRAGIGDAIGPNGGLENDLGLCAPINRIMRIFCADWFTAGVLLLCCAGSDGLADSNYTFLHAL